MRIGVLGINHKLADLKLRELLAKICQRRLSPDHSVHGVHSFVLLSTCNRTEIYFSSSIVADTHSYLLNILRKELFEDFDQKLYSYFGKDCLSHLCRVTTGLDSAIVAETEIQGQVKAAYEIAQKHHTLPYEIHFLFQKALQTGKKIRSFLPHQPGLPDIEHAVYQTGQHLFKNLENTRVLFLGASEINEKILNFFKKKTLGEISLCNRSKEIGKEFADKYQIPFLPWQGLSSWSDYDWIIVGTKAPDYLIKKDSIPLEMRSQKLVIDLSVPRNVDPMVARHKQIVLLNIDQINRMLKVRSKSMALSLALAEEMIETSTAQQIKTFQEKESHRLRICAVGS